VKFLSREWLDHLSALTSPASPAATLSVHQRVTGGPDGDVDYVLRVGDGRATFEPGPGPADVELTADYETAAAISQGVLTPAAAFAAGRLRVGGSRAVLVVHQEALAALGLLLTDAAEGTTY
jgi:putative sterol carrier protein